VNLIILPGINAENFAFQIYLHDPNNAIYMSREWQFYFSKEEVSAIGKEILNLAFYFNDVLGNFNILVITDKEILLFDLKIITHRDMEVIFRNKFALNSSIANVKCSGNYLAYLKDDFIKIYRVNNY
jgi:hypothetical protein